MEVYWHIESHGCLFVREGGKHTVFRNTGTGAMTSILRHRAIKKQLLGRFAMT